MGIKFYQVDAFTKKTFGGNPAVVCLLDEPLDDTTMKHIAREMNLSETAFVQKQDDGYSLRWFTPKIEVELCGHATLASAHILWEIGELEPAEEAVFHTLSGVLTAKNKEGKIVLNFPTLEHMETVAPVELTEALGVEPVRVARFASEYLVEVDGEDLVRQVEPDFQGLKKLPERGVVVTSLSQSDEYDFVSRFFLPNAGVDEDPVTGLIHCCLGPYWGERLGKSNLTAYQASERGGKVEIELQGDRVSLGGFAVTICQGEFVI